MNNTSLVIMLFTAAGILTLATCEMGRATPWSVPDGEGGWKPNPECSSADCHETGEPDKPITEPEPPTPPTPPVDPNPEPPPPVNDHSKPDMPYRGGNGRNPVTYPGVMAFKTCCIHDGQRYVTVKPLRSKEVAARDCAAMAQPPLCQPLSDPNPYTGPLK